TPEQARSHPYSNVITRCVGANSDVMPDIYLGTVKPKDLYLLASDGLTGMLEDHQLADLLTAIRMPQEQVDELITEANRHGGLDNCFRTDRGVAQHEYAQPPGRAVQLSRDPGEAELSRSVCAGELYHRAVALYQWQVQGEHVRLGGEVEKQLARPEPHLPGEPGRGVPPPARIRRPPIPRR